MDLFINKINFYRFQKKLYASEKNYVGMFFDKFFTVHKNSSPNYSNM